MLIQLLITQKCCAEHRSYININVATVYALNYVLLRLMLDYKREIKIK